MVHGASTAVHFPYILIILGFQRVLQIILDIQFNILKFISAKSIITHTTTGSRNTDEKYKASMAEMDDKHQKNLNKQQNSHALFISGHVK